MKKEVTKKEVKEAKKIIKNLEDNPKLPRSDNILEWSMDELKAYIKESINGMSPAKKIKFARELNKRIISEKKKAKKSEILTTSK